MCKATVTANAHIIEVPEVIFASVGKVWKNVFEIRMSLRYSKAPNSTRSEDKQSPIDWRDSFRHSQSQIGH
jgi:hypothetical protein